MHACVERGKATLKEIFAQAHSLQPKESYFGWYNDFCSVFQVGFFAINIDGDDCILLSCYTAGLYREYFKGRCKIMLCHSSRLWYSVYSYRNLPKFGPEFIDKNILKI